jgi:hypothetical protein
MPVLVKHPFPSPPVVTKVGRTGSEFIPSRKKGPRRPGAATDIAWVRNQPRTCPTSTGSEERKKNRDAKGGLVVPGPHIDSHTHLAFERLASGRDSKHASAGRHVSRHCRRRVAASSEPLAAHAAAPGSESLIDRCAHWAWRGSARPRRDGPVRGQKAVPDSTADTEVRAAPNVYEALRHTRQNPLRLVSTLLAASRWFPTGVPAAARAIAWRWCAAT